MPIIAVGVDASKGYADFCFQNEAGSILQPTQRYDDTPAGHEAVRTAFAQLRSAHLGVQFFLGIECSGGLERNWLQLFRALGEDCRVYRLNPLAVKKFLETDLHRNVTDAISAQGIAAYLRLGLRPADKPYEPQMEGARNLLRHVFNSINRQTQISNELQSLLPSVHPDLVQYCRQGLPQWVLHLLAQYPTVTALSQADAQAVAKIRYMKQGHVKSLLAAARQSVAALRDTATGAVVADLATQALTLTHQIAQHKKQLWEMLKADAETKLLKSIHGIGRWTAVVLRLEVGPFRRFHSDRAVVAYAGLDPRVKQSGDSEQHLGISRRGKHQIRACLYMPVLVATRTNPVIRDFYQRLRKANKLPLVALTACMAKLLRIAYACVVSGREFDPEYHQQVQRRREAERQSQADMAPAGEDTPVSGPDPVVGSLTAPVSAREARRRAQATMRVSVRQPDAGKGLITVSG